MDEAKLLQRLQERLCPERYQHSLAVAEAAKTLAAQYGAPVEKAYLAGLLHDIMKCAPLEEQLQTLQNAGILLQSYEREIPNIWHARAGAVYLEQEGLIRDAEILSAVRWHTTGNAGRSRLDQVVYLADFISADRNYPDLAQVRTLAKDSLEAACLYTLRYMIPCCIRKQGLIHPDSIAFYNELIIKERLHDSTGTDQNHCEAAGQ